QHMRAFVEHRLLFRIAFDLTWRNPQILERRLRGLVLLRILLGWGSSLVLVFTWNRRGRQVVCLYRRRYYLSAARPRSGNSGEVPALSKKCAGKSNRAEENG
ncbi:MAG: hypothetical protein WBD10_16055, partial [Acidobacteriaceae bacterium]